MSRNDSLLKIQIFGAARFSVLTTTKAEDVTEEPSIAAGIGLEDQSCFPAWQIVCPKIDG
jgi:hypothetical protein